MSDCTRYSIDVLVVQDRGMSRQRLGRADAWAIGATIVGNVENRSAVTTPPVRPRRRRPHRVPAPAGNAALL